MMEYIKGLRTREIAEYTVAGIVAGLILRGLKHEMKAHSASNKAKLGPIKATGPRRSGD